LNTRRVLTALLISTVSMLSASCSLWQGKHSTPATPSVDTGEEAPKPVIDPEIARRAVKVPKIRATNVEVGAFGGVLSTQDLQSAPIYGLRAAYHISEDFFFEAEYGRSTVSDQVRREIGQPFFATEVIGLTTYGIDLGYNLLPGEVFWGKNRAMTSTLYLLAGAGNTSFNNEDYLTYNVGFGFKVLPINRMSIRLEARDRLWNSDLLGEPQLTNNLEMTLGMAVYF